ncbi:MAG: hypothetical protein JW720_02560 [Sedimentisphaerales bacterium]|nr:hypothetical protein [Sedimentisphaerales bacterium]
MKKRKNYSNYLMLAVTAILCVGCTVEKPIELVLKPDDAGKTTQKQNAPSRFQDPASQNPTAVESAMQLSAKYAELSEEMANLRAENQKLFDENQDLRDRLTPCQNRLAQTQKELAQANDLLIEMRIELNNWKTNILGFRDEIRQADKAQLQALVKILQVLGGEPKTDSAKLQQEKPAATSKQNPEEQIMTIQPQPKPGELNG